MELGLSRITQLVRKYHPRLPWSAVHLAGTNGKGTTAACLSALLHNKGVSVGRFTSPHLIHRHDCISIGEKSIDKDLFLEVEHLIKQRDRENGINATSFELLTATAYEVFVREKVQVGVIECGLGGRLDATNIFSSEEVLCTIITTINKDHQEMLGDTLEAIATEKAGILKPGVPVVIGNIPAGPKGVIEKRAGDLGCQVLQMRLVGNEQLRLHETLPEVASVPATFIENLQTALLAYQIVSKKMDLGPTPDFPLGVNELKQIHDQVERSWRGRTQLLSVKPLVDRDSPVLLDGAHNEHAIVLLRRHVLGSGSRRDCPPVTWVHAVSANRDLEDIMRSKEIRSCDRYILTEFGQVDGMPWVKPHQTSTLRNHLLRTIADDKVHVAANPQDALQVASRITPDDELIVIAGSLYLVGDVLRLLEEAEGSSKIKSERA